LKKVQQRLWVLTTAIIALAISAGLGYSVGSSTHGEVVENRIDVAVRSRAAAETLSVVRCSRDLPAGTILAWDDMFEDQVKVPVCPVGALNSRFIGLGRRLQHAKTKGDNLWFGDVGLSERTRSHFLE